MSNIFEFYIIRKLYDNVIKMLNIRGFELSSYNNEDLIIRHQKTIEERNNYEYLDIACNNDEKQCFLRFLYTDKTDGPVKKIKEYRDYITKTYNCTENDNIHIVLISNNNPFMTNIGEKFYNLDYKNLFIYWHKNLMFPIMEHKLVPKHELFRSEEHKQLFKNLMIQKYDLQHIKRDDPVIKYLGLKDGDICKIEQTNKTSGVIYNYRLVIEDVKIQDKKEDKPKKDKGDKPKKDKGDKPKKEKGDKPKKNKGDKKDKGDKLGGSNKTESLNLDVDAKIDFDFDNDINIMPDIDVIPISEKKTSINNHDNIQQSNELYNDVNSHDNIQQSNELYNDVNSQESNDDEGETKQCNKCKEEFITYSGKDACPECRDDNNASFDDVKSYDNEECKIKTVNINYDINVKL